MKLDVEWSWFSKTGNHHPSDFSGLLALRQERALVSCLCSHCLPFFSALFRFNSFLVLTQSCWMVNFFPSHSFLNQQ